MIRQQLDTTVGGSVTHNHISKYPLCLNEHWVTVAPRMRPIHCPQVPLRKPHKWHHRRAILWIARTAEWPDTLCPVCLLNPHLVWKKKKTGNLWDQPAMKCETGAMICGCINPHGRRQLQVRHRSPSRFCFVMVHQIQIRPGSPTACLPGTHCSRRLCNSTLVEHQPTTERQVHIESTLSPYTDHWLRLCARRHFFIWLIDSLTDASTRKTI